MTLSPLCAVPARRRYSGAVGTAGDTDGAIARRVIAAGAEPGSARADEAELCARLGPRIRLYGLRHLGSEDAAADLVQRVLTVVIEKLRAGAVREPERIGSFALGTARMICRELRRQRRRETPTEGVSELADRGVRPPQPLALDQLARCLEGLSERDRAVVVLTYFGDQSAAEIAASLALERNNVRQIRHRSLARLRDCMELTA